MRGILSNITNTSSEIIEEYDYSDIKGQEYAKRALVVAAAGKHPLLMIGPPGCGKTMACKADAYNINTDYK